MGAILSIMVRDVRSTFRNKMTAFWTLVFPIMFLLLAAYLWTPQDSLPMTVKVGVVSLDEPGNFPVNSSLTIKVMGEVEYKGRKLFEIREYAGQDEGLKAVKNGTIDALIVFPEGYSRNLTYGFPAIVRIYVNRADVQKSQVTTAILTGFIDRFGEEIGLRRIGYALNYIPPQAMGNVTREQIELWMRGFVKPINATVEEILPETLMTRARVLGWHVLAMIGVEILFTGMISGAVMIVEERDRGTLPRLLSAPISPWSILIGKTMSVLVILGISAILVSLVGVFGLGAELPLNPLNPLHLLSIALIFVGGISSIGIGLIISIFAKTSDAASGMASAFSWPLMFLTGIVIPKWLLPEWMRSLAGVFPVSASIEVMRGILVYNWGISQVLPSLPTILISPVIVYSLGILCYRWNLKRMLT